LFNIIVGDMMYTYADFGAFRKTARKTLILLILLLLVIVLFGCNENTEEGNSDTDAEGCLIRDPEDETYFGTINGYAFYRFEDAVCEMVVGNITVDGYDFGFFNWGCDDNLNWIGYTARKDGVTYQLQDLVDQGEVTTKDIYEKIYICDDAKWGQYYFD